LIGKGGDFEDSESTSFSIPFVPYLSTTNPVSPDIPSQSKGEEEGEDGEEGEEGEYEYQEEEEVPSEIPSQSMNPSTSFSPTDTRYWVNVAVVHDDYSW